MNTAKSPKKQQRGWCRGVRGEERDQDNIKASEGPKSSQHIFIHPGLQRVHHQQPPDTSVV